MKKPKRADYQNDTIYHIDLIDWQENRIKELEEFIESGCPKDCIEGYDNVKFCKIRNGYGFGKCSHCI